MDETRAQAYLQLIQTLLTCPNGEENQIFNANSELVDAELVQMMRVVAAQLSEKNQENQATVLLQMATQIAHFLGMNDEGDSDDSEGKNPQKYINFILKLLQIEQDSDSDIAVIYPMLGQRQHLLNARFSESLEEVAENLISAHPEASESIVALIENLSIHISNFPRGNKANNLEIAITGYQIVLNNREPGREKWGGTKNNLAIAYSKRINGLRAENLERAIGFFEVALTVYTLEDFREQWAMTQNNLANAYRERINGLRADNLELAIGFYERALTAYTLEDFREQWAWTQNNLANTYSHRIKGSRAENLELAIDRYEAALTVYTFEDFPKDWAETQNNLAIAYHNRIKGSRAQNLERAIGFFEATLIVRTLENFREQWAEIQNNLANAYRERINGLRADNLERAIKLYEKALTVFTLEDFREKWGGTQNNLANAYLYRINGDRAANLERAIGFFEVALTVYTLEDFPEKLALTQNNLAIAYHNRIKGSRADNLERAILYYRDALSIRTREAFPQNYAETLFNLGLAYREVPDLQLAYHTFATAIDTVELLRGEIHSGDESKQKLAEEWNKLYRNMVEVCLKLKNYTEAIEYVERSKARNLVELLATRDLYPKGDIPETVINELSRLRREIDAEQRRLDNQQTNRNSNGGTISGERSLQIDSLQTTSRDSTNLTQLRQQLDELLVRDIQPIDPDFLLTQEVKGISYSDIQALTTENTAIVEWYILGDKFLTFIITPQSPNPIVWQSSKADFQTLVNWGEEYLRDYQKEDKTQWRENLAPRLQSLSEILHINEILGRVPKHCDQLILIPHRFLHLFPLHALPVSREIWQRFNPETQSPEPANPCLLDCFKQGVSYSPSCQLLQQAQRRKRPNFTHLFAVQNPTNDLQFTDLEVPAISQHFHPKDILVKNDAKKSVIDDSRLRIAHCAHFSCHGYFNFQQPLLSALLLADSELDPPSPEENPTRYLPLRNGKILDLTKCLTLADIFALDFRECRLVVLSACETGISDFNSISDEYISLPSGFLVAGSSSVVPTLWAVNDLSTSFLMIKFYQLLKAGLSVSLALNTAQLWLRDATKEDLQVWTKQLPLHRVEKATLYDMLKKISSKEIRPFQSPYHWAAFCSVGQ
ncbi:MULTISPECIES: CHAT domain-containing tetratricopeptide repeat protein [unclassified Microcoleus]|uniref:CHAT domain-containing tetratricopeptide repeat protein n=1 Tax=unclassified Microcoleus TaxID=2642155 RepID=UPI002FCEA031